MSRNNTVANGSEAAAVAAPRPMLQSWDGWLKQIGRTATTGWRWRKAGWIVPVNIAGRLYVSDDAKAEFVRRAQAGQFSQVHKVPVRVKDAA